MFLGLLTSTSLRAASRRLVVVRGVQAEVLISFARLAELGLSLPPLGSPKGSYALTSRCGDLLFLSGHLPQPIDAPLITGKVGAEVSVEEATEAAKWVGLNLISTIKAEAGDLDRVLKIHKLVGFVNCVDGFASQPAVVNGCSDLMLAVFGEKGRHARSAVGTNALPLDVPVEIEAIVELAPSS
ncbi:hypothetical protein CTAYLR_005670 [Chrysophaeum taylorii]|uniref:Endoribonuclease L-PSP/chorismate mutase-like domain-containing protein n=1 Tax=Chrysophaeum taylorii TaxID=2483200 RepID=A0AAD7XSY5_9STRA|nr:hypothetical protein CTAYLR_005670 [Chrysophaeum taylorii]